MEDHEGPIPQPEKPTRAESIRAVLGTLRHNKDVQVDAAFAGGSFVVGAFFGGPVAGLVSAGLSQWIFRPVLQTQEYVNASNKAKKTGAPSSYTYHDPRYGISILKEAWTTGQVQPTRKEHVLLK